MNSAAQVIETAARDSYGRLLAWLSARSGDIAMAEDALAEALTQALAQWPSDGVPDEPEAWLLTVARRRLIDVQRRAATQLDAAQRLRLEQQLKLQQDASEASSVPFRERLPDRRLELLFVCTHPEIPYRMRTPLMLQAVLGMSAERMASALLIAPTTLGQRLVRVKREIVAKRLAFEVPPEHELPERLEFVMEAIYAAFGADWDTEPGQGASATGLASEALWLSRLLVDLVPEAAEAKGLYALLCFCESRRAARRSPEGAFIPLEEQDVASWNMDLIIEGEKALWLAAKQQQRGPYQIEAAIHSIHAHRARSGHTDWRAIYEAYFALVRDFPTLGAQVGFAASAGRVGDCAEGLNILDELDPKRVAHYQPFWAVRAWLLSELGDRPAARAAYSKAIGLCSDPAVRAWLSERAARLGA